MTPCPPDEDLVRFADGALSLEETERLMKHVGVCARCRETDELLQGLIGDVKAPMPAAIDVQAHRRAVMERLDRPIAGPSRSPRRWVLASIGGAAACAVAAYLGVRTPPERAAFQARGGPAEATIARDVRVRPCAVHGGLQPLAPGAIVEGSTPLTATYRNLGVAPAFLLLFAVDARHVVHWIAPQYARPDVDPVATTLPVSIRDEVLDTTAVLEDVSPGPLRIVAVISSAPARVSDVESLEGTAIDVADLARRFPAGTDIRETIVEVRGTDGGAR